MKISVDTFTDWISQGSRNAPLLFLLILPFYNLEGGNAMIAQMQLFQIGAMFSFLFSIGKKSVSIFHPFRVFAVFALSQLFFCYVDNMSIFHIQMIFIAYILFESILSASTSFSALRAVVLIFLYLNLFFCFFQLFNVPLPVLSYLNTDRSHVIQGIWIGSAYCGAFMAFAVPFILSIEHKIKWPFLVLTLFFIVKTHSIFALGASVFAVAVWVLFRSRKLFACTMLPGFVVFASYYWFFDKGDFSGEMQRFFIWNQTLKAIAQEPIFGHAFGSYQRFGMENVFSLNGETGMYFQQLHNEYFQTLHEGGAIGFMIFLALILRVAFITIQNSWNRSIFALGTSLEVLFLIAFGQSVFHVANLAIFAIFALAIFETENLKLKRRISHVY